ncbi:hypothetical protein GEU84_015775 [Fertoebacter nigrum]|uniref:Uncharacterized protein n=1 Tax=Fertoeibacter niger TaxID=2656921 RepID=A0A8X8H3Z2_9RHOB|nr:hypothetical protein [Fertoeibacter niger]NUB45857.1 hypothetical protein [Fertoeibacter niger]
MTWRASALPVGVAVLAVLVVLSVRCIRAWGTIAAKGTAAKAQVALLHHKAVAVETRLARHFNQDD